jgi:hypothetical protein
VGYVALLTPSKREAWKALVPSVALLTSFRFGFAEENSSRMPIRYQAEKPNSI